MRKVKQNKSKKTRYIGELDSSNLFRNEFSKADKDSQIFFLFCFNLEKCTTGAN